MSFPPIDPNTVAAVAPVALDIAKQLFKKYTSKNHGSKVKMGEFAEASIEMFGDKACIKLNENSSQILLLTSDNVESYHYVEEKKRLVGATYHTYFYYNIKFKDGTESYVRMRRKYRDAMEQYC